LVYSFSFHFCRFESQIISRVNQVYNLYRLIKNKCFSTTCVCACNWSIWDDAKKQEMNSKEYNFVRFSFQISTWRGNIKMDKEIPNVQKLSQLINPTLFYVITHDFFAVWISYKLFKREVVCKKTSSMQGIVRPPIGWE
jgi:hypothetical protein